jgi:hypothetical protein
MRNTTFVQSCTPLATNNPDHNQPPENTPYSPGNNPVPAGGKLIYRSEKGPLTEFLQVEIEDCNLAAWFMLPEHECRPVEIRLFTKNGKHCFHMLFTGWHIHTCQISYYWHRAKGKTGPYIARGMKYLAGIIQPEYLHPEVIREGKGAAE